MYIIYERSSFGSWDLKNIKLLKKLIKSTEKQYEIFYKTEKALRKDGKRKFQHVDNKSKSKTSSFFSFSFHFAIIERKLIKMKEEDEGRKFHRNIILMAEKNMKKSRWGKKVQMILSCLNLAYNIIFFFSLWRCFLNK